MKWEMFSKNRTIIRVQYTKSHSASSICVKRFSLIREKFVCPDVWSSTVAAADLVCETLYVFMYIIYIPIYYHKSQNAINCD